MKSIYLSLSLEFCFDLHMYALLSFKLRFQPALFENVVSEMVQYLQDVIQAKPGEKQVNKTSNFSMTRNNQ